MTARAFLKEKRVILAVSCTAIKAISAKPILDIAVQLESIQNMDIDALTAMGYDYCGSRQGNGKYHLFVLRGPNQISLRHIHCYDKTESEIYMCAFIRQISVQRILRTWSTMSFSILELGFNTRIAQQANAQGK